MTTAEAQGVFHSQEGHAHFYAFFFFPAEGSLLSSLEERLAQGHMVHL